jgi:microcystin-dependent protein
VSEPFLGQITLIAFTFAPKGWAFCNGQLLPINQNQALFALLGTTYGGDGRVTFALPDLRGRAPVHRGNEIQLGQTGGETGHTLIQSELPTHAHIVQGTANQGAANTAGGNVLAEKGRRGKNVFGLQPVGVDIQPLDPSSVSVAGGSQAHSNMQPYLVLNFVIAMVGIFPSRN